jgi:hypothetical protein
MTTTTKTTVSMTDIRWGFKQAYLNSLSERGFHFVRVTPQGVVYTSEDGSNSRLLDEHDGNTPCITTIGVFESRDLVSAEEIASYDEGGWDDWFEVNIPDDLESRLESTGCTLID